MKSGEAKNRFLLNVISNFIAIFVATIISIWLTPYLVQTLGVAVYGLVPLTFSFMEYLQLITKSMSHSVSRFISISYFNSDFESSNSYFNTAMVTFLGFWVVIIIPVVFLIYHLPSIINIPDGYENDSRWLLSFIVAASFLFSIKSPFSVTTFIKHRFDLANSIEIFSRILRVCVIFLTFHYLKPSLIYFGFSYFLMALSGFIFTCYLAKKLAPQIKICFTSFDWHLFKEINTMSLWVVINDIGALLYLNMSYLIINKLLGSEAVGFYSPIAQWATLLGLLAGALSNVFTPITYEYIATGKLDVMAVQISRAVKILTFLVGYPVAFLCGLGKPLLGIWLGESFEKMWVLVWLMLLPWIISISVRPLLSLFRGINRIRMPAIVTIIMGLFNILIGIIFIKTTSLGVYGVALALLICLGGKNLFFTTVFASIILNKNYMFFISKMLPGLMFSLGTAILLFVVSLSKQRWSLFEIVATAVVSSVIYFTITYKYFLNKEENQIIVSLFSKAFKKQRTVSS